MCCIPILAPLSDRVAELFLSSHNCLSEYKLRLQLNMSRSEQYTINTIEDWNEVCENVIPKLNQFPIVLLEGNLGTGKTTFVKTISKMLNVIDEVTSPTYSLVQQYLTEEGNSIYHLDLYRLESYDEIIGAGIENLIENEDYYCLFVEWPDLVKETLDTYINIQITISEKGKRDVLISYINY